MEELSQKVKEVLEGGGSYTSPFLHPRRRKIAEEVLTSFPEAKYFLYGGYPAAERVQLVLWPAAVPAFSPATTLQAFLIKSAAHEGELTPREVQGALLASGLTRDDIGDIIVAPGEGAARVVLRKEKASGLEEMAFLGEMPVQVERIDLSRLQPSRSSGKEVRGTVSSLRLDSIMSLGLGCSRSRASFLIKEGSVLVNYRKERSPSCKVNPGDIISFSGGGHSLQVESLEGVSRKGRRRVVLKKFIRQGG